MFRRCGSRRGLERGVRSGTVGRRRWNNRKKHQAEDHHSQNRDDHNVPVSKADDALFEISVLSGKKIPRLRFRSSRGMLSIVHGLLLCQALAPKIRAALLYKTRRTAISLQEPVASVGAGNIKMGRTKHGAEVMPLLGCANLPHLPPTDRPLRVPSFPAGIHRDE